MRVQVGRKMFAATIDYGQFCTFICVTLVLELKIGLIHRVFRKDSDYLASIGIVTSN